MTDVWNRAAAAFREPTPGWASPGALATDLDATWHTTPALSLIDQALVDVAEGRTKRLMVFCPPQEGKTTLVARTFPLWLLQHRPDTHVVIASYELETAQRIGRGIRDEIAQHNGHEDTLDLGLRVQRSDRAAARWTLDGHKGGVYCTGIGGALTGRKCDVMIIDDPCKDHEQAMSSTYRERVWEWWRTTARTRLGPDSSVVLIMTRWHASDLAGKLLADASEPWRVLSIPAVADSPDDPLGRELGEPLISARRRTAEDWESTKRAVGDYTWASLYQQRPAPLSGGIFNTDKIGYWRGMPSADSGQAQIDLAGKAVTLDSCWTFCVADLAASVRTSADYTAIATFAITLDQDLVLLDMRRERMKPDGHLDAVKPMLARWGAHTLFVESTMQSSTLVYEAGRAGIPVTPLKADTDKVTRSLPAAARMDQGRVWVPFGADWVGDYIAELAAFPAGANDDMVDCTSYAARIAATHYVPPTNDPWSVYEDRETAEYERRINEAFGPMPDIWNMQW